MNNKGFTLIELLLYVSILGSMILSVSGFLFLLMQSRVKNQTIAEVEQQGVQVIQLVTQTIRNAETITSPTAATTATTATIDVVTASLDPTIFDLAGGTIRIAEGTGSPIALTNSQVTASSLSFYNLTRTTTQGTMRIQFTLTHINPSGRNEYDYSKTFYATSTLRY